MDKDDDENTYRHHICQFWFILVKDYGDLILADVMFGSLRGLIHFLFFDGTCPFVENYFNVLPNCKNVLKYSILRGTILAKVIYHMRHEPKHNYMFSIKGQ